MSSSSFVAGTKTEIADPTVTGREEICKTGVGTLGEGTCTAAVIGSAATSRSVG